MKPTLPRLTLDGAFAAVIAAPDLTGDAGISARLAANAGRRAYSIWATQVLLGGDIEPARQDLARQAAKVLFHTPGWDSPVRDTIKTWLLAHRA